jgi:diguanylate cyclase (GGDEF)-like protein
VQDSKSQTIILDARGPSEQPEGPRTPVLVVVQGDQIGRRYLLNEPDLVLGRDPDQAQLTIRDPSVSGRHARVQVDVARGRFRLVDMGSCNGTYLNGRRVDTIALCEGDKIFLGETVLRFSFHDAIEEDFHSRLDELMHVERPFCVLMLDMDGLKQINDRHGHQMGSYCIGEAGKLIKRALEPNGVGCRFGGDEFVAYVRNCGLEEALELGEEIRRAVEDFEFCRDGVRVAPTLSIGVAELVRGVKSAEELTRLADDALYRAKKDGRNTVSD